MLIDWPRAFLQAVGRRRRPAEASTASAATPDGEPTSHHIIGGSHRVTLPTPTQASDYLLILRVEPSEPNCFLTIDVNDVRQRALLLNMRAVLCCRLAWADIAEAPQLTVTFDTSESFDPDGGRLSVFDATLVKFTPPGPTLRPAGAPDPSPPPLGTPASEQALLGQFVSFGDNCEFGLYQRRHGVDAVGFLRLAAVPLDGLILALRERFEACYDPAEFYFEILQYPGREREYILRHQRYGINWHTLVAEAQADGPRMIVREYQKLLMLLRMLVESLYAGNRIIVYKCNVPLEREDRSLLARLLAPYGHNGLLVVVPAANRKQVGTVVVEDGLMIGHIDKFLSYDAANLRASDAWMTLCRNAYARWRERQPAPHLPVDPT